MFGYYNIPYCKLNRSAIVTYTLPPVYDSGNNISDASLSNLANNKSKGELSQAAKRRALACLKAWCNTVELTRKYDYKLYCKRPVYWTLLTLTLPSQQVHTDKRIKRDCLNHLIIKLQRNYKVTNYFWRAESQANGNIHFHVVLDVFIDKTKIRKDWEEIINKLGYVDRANHNSSNYKTMSTWIEKIKNTECMESYLIAYITKQNGKRPVEGKIWGVSESVEKMKVKVTLLDSSLSEMCKYLKNQKWIKYVNTDYSESFVLNYQYIRDNPNFTNQFIDEFEYKDKDKIRVHKVLNVSKLVAHFSEYEAKQMHQHYAIQYAESYGIEHSYKVDQVITSSMEAFTGVTLTDKDKSRWQAKIDYLQSLQLSIF
jgi:hypothetical protein